MIYSGSDRVPKELWMEVHDIVQETGIKTIKTNNRYQDQDQEEEMQKSKMAV